MRVLGEIGAANKPMITVLNKVDRVPDESQLSLLEHAVMRDGPCIRYSAHRGDGRGELLEAIEQLVGDAYPTREYAVPYARHDIVAMIHRSGRVLETHYEAEHVRLVAQVPEALTRKLDGFVNGNGSRDDARAVFSMQNHG
jgi:GTP-binding protein HflX